MEFNFRDLNEDELGLLHEFAISSGTLVISDEKLSTAASLLEKGFLKITSRQKVWVSTKVCQILPHYDLVIPALEAYTHWLKE